MRGAYLESGMFGFPLSLGEPKPDMPETLGALDLVTLLPLPDRAGREDVWTSCSPLSLSWRFRAGSEW